MVWIRNIPFQAPEHVWLLGTLNHSGDKDFSGAAIDWEWLAKSMFAPALRKQKGAPDIFIKQAEDAFIRNLLRNELRLKQIKTLAMQFQEMGVRVMFLKGAAELAENQNNSQYLGSRVMADIDFLCHMQDMETVHGYLVKQGNILYDYGLRQKHNKILQMTGELTYNRYTPQCVELHVDSWFLQHQQRSYPRGFEKLLWNGARGVWLDDVEVCIPAREHMLVHLICHAAGKKDYGFFCSKQKHPYDEGTGSKKYKDILNRRIEIHALRYLFTLDMFLRAAGNDISYKEVLSLLSGVEDRSLIRLHMLLAALYTPYTAFASFAGEEWTEDRFLSERKKVLERIVLSQLPVKYLKKYCSERAVVRIKTALYTSGK